MIDCLSPARQCQSGHWRRRRQRFADVNVLAANEELPQTRCRVMRQVQSENRRNHTADERREPWRPFVMPHPEQGPTDNENVDEDGEQDEHDRNCHGREGDDEGGCVHTYLRPGMSPARQACTASRCARDGSPAPNRFSWLVESGITRRNLRGASATASVECPAGL